jgi:RNA polymerase sigma factor (sigma-70 family)
MTKLIEDCLDSNPLPDGRLPAKISRFRGRSTLRTFLYVTALRIGIDAHRRRRARPEIESLEFGQELQSNEPTVEFEQVSAEAVDEEARRFTEAILGLTAKRRALLALVHGRGLARGAAGRLLGLPPYQVTRELKRAIAEIRDRLRLCGDEGWTSERIGVWLRAWTIAVAGILEEAADQGGGRDVSE